MHLMRPFFYSSSERSRTKKGRQSNQRPKSREETPKEGCTASSTCCARNMYPWSGYTENPTFDLGYCSFNWFQCRV